MLFGAASRPRPRGASIRRENEKRRLETTDVASVRSPEIRPVREYGPRQSVDGRGSCVFLCGESPPPPGGSDPSRAREETTQNDRRCIDSEPRDQPRSRVRGPPTRRWSRFLCYLVRRVAHAPGGFDPPRSRGATPQNERRSGHFGRAVAAAVTRISKSGCRPETRARFSISGGVVHPAISKSGPRAPPTHWGMPSDLLSVVDSRAR